MPKTFDTCTKDTNRGPRSNNPSKASKSKKPSSETGTYASSASRSWHNNCQGTMFEWCSISVSTTRSPRCTFWRPHVYATRLIAAVALAVNTVSSTVEPSHEAIRPRASSNNVVASSASGYTPRWIDARDRM